MRQVVVGLMSGQVQEGGAGKLQGGEACSGTPAASKTLHTQDMPTPTVFVSLSSLDLQLVNLCTLCCVYNVCVCMHACMSLCVCVYACVY